MSSSEAPSNYGRNLKVLVSAFSILPDKGSEPGVGWSWVIEMARQGIEVQVVTSRSQSERGNIDHPDRDQVPPIKFHLVDPPIGGLSLQLYKRAPRLWYVFWHYYALRAVKRIVEDFRPDYLHHLTWGSVRFPVPMWRIKVPLVIGPVGGGELMPLAFERALPLGKRLPELLRRISLEAFWLLPDVKVAYRAASKVFAKTFDTKYFIDRRALISSQQLLEIGVLPEIVSPKAVVHPGDGQFKVLYAGRFIYWKGVDLVVSAFAAFRNTYPNAKLTMVGRGEELASLKRQALGLGCVGDIEWIEWVPREELQEIYSSHHLFLFPSLHDSSGNVVLEAMSRGLPVICLNCGGPAAVVGEGAPGVVEVVHDPSSTIDAIVERMLRFAQDPECFEMSSVYSLQRCQSLTIENLVKTVYPHGRGE